MQGQQFQMLMIVMMQRKLLTMHTNFPMLPPLVMQGLMHNNNEISSVTESPRSIPKDSDEVLDLEVKQ